MSQRTVGIALRVVLIAVALGVSVAPASHAQGQIAIGQVMTSQLTAASPVNADGRRYAMWTFMGSAGQFIQLDMQSTEIDSYLVLQDQNGNQLQVNDDGGGGLNSRITYTLPYTGMYRILAMSYRTSGVMFGNYTLSLTGGGMTQTVPVGGGMIAVGQAVTGQLTAGSPVDNNGRRYAMYQFAGTAGQAIQIDMTSNELDSYLILQDQMGNQLQTNDDGGGSLNSRINYTLTYTGMYRVLAMSFRTSGVMFGTYTLAIMPMGMAAQPMVTPMQPQVTPMNTNPLGVVGTIGLNQQAQGVLSQADARYDGKPFQAYSFQCTPGLTFTMNVLSSWDNYALVFDPMNNVVARDDDTGEGLNAQVTYTCTMAGVYRLAVSVFSTSTTPGPYTLQVTGVSGGAAPMVQPMVQPMAQPVSPTATNAVPAPGQVASIIFGQMMQGRLETGDQTMQDGTFADIWTFQGGAGQAVTIDVRSDQFDTYAQLLDAAGNRLAEDDDSGGDLNSRITFTLPATGQYQIVVNNYGSTRRAGNYTVWLH